jgi:hypothetical protein
MRFANVDGEEVRAVFVLIIDFDEISNLAAEWRSSVAAENEHQRFLTDPFVQVVRRAPVKRINANVRSPLADTEIAFVPLRQRIPKEAVNVARPAHEMRESKVRGKKNQKEYREQPFPQRASSWVNVFFHVCSSNDQGSPRLSHKSITAFQ